jgi:hypothetical protein
METLREAQIGTPVARARCHIWGRMPDQGYSHDANPR